MVAPGPDTTVASVRLLVAKYQFCLFPTCELDLQDLLARFQERIAENSMHSEAPLTRTRVSV